MAFGFVSGGVLFLCAVTCALYDSKTAPQWSPRVPIVVECKARSLFVSVDIPPSGVEPRFEAADATGMYPVTESYGAQCGYTYSADPLLGRVVLRASYFSCHTDNQNDEVFTFMFSVIVTDERGQELFYNVSKTCTDVSPFSSREITCEQNYMEASVSRGPLCLTAGGGVKGGFSAGSPSVEGWQVMLQQDGQQSELMSAEDAAALGYVIMVTPGRLVFRTTFGQPFASVQTVSGVAVEVIQATLFFKQNWILVMVDLVAACSLDEGFFDDYSLNWRTPAVMTPLFVGPSELKSEYVGMGVDGDLLDEQDSLDRGYSVTVTDEKIVSSIPIAAEGGVRQSFVLDGVYNEVYTVQLTYQQMFMDQYGVDTKYNVVRQMTSPPIPRPPFSVNQTTSDERIFTVYLGNIPFDVQLVSVELNGMEISVLAAMQMGYSITRVPESQANDTFAYILRVPFDDQLVVMQYFTGGILQYSLSIKWTLNLLPRMDPYYHFSSVTALVYVVVPPVFESVCTDSGISFMRGYYEYDYLWDVAIGQYPLTEQLAAERGYVMTNDGPSFQLDVPLFTIGYIYENITLKQFFGTFELLTRNARTLEVEQSSRKRCLFRTTELLVCSTDGIMTVVSDLTKSVPSANPRRTTLLDPTCRPQEVDKTRVLFSIRLNTCGTRVQVDNQYVTYENEIIFHESYSPDKKPVITRDAAHRITVRCVYPVRGTESLFVDRQFTAEMPGIGQMEKPMKVPPQMFVQKQTIMTPPQAAEKKPAEHVRGGQWNAPVDKRAWSLGPN